MAIRDFGESLLADVRKRKDAQAKAASPSTLEKALQIGAEIIPLIGNRELSQSLNDFKQNEEVLRLNLQAKQAEQVASYVDTLNTNMASSDFEGVDYFVNVEAQKLANQDLVVNEDARQFKKNQKGTNFYLGEKTAAYSKNLEVKKRAEEAYKNYQQASAAVTKYRSSGTREDAVELAKATRPSKGGSFINRLTGRGTEAVTSTMVEDFVNSTYGKSTEEASSFYALLKNSNGDFMQARAVDKELQPISLEAEQAASIEEGSLEPVGDGSFVKVITTTRPNGNIEVEVKEPLDLRSKESRLAARVAGYNSITVAPKLLNEKGLNAFKAQMKPDQTDSASYEHNNNLLESLRQKEEYQIDLTSLNQEQRIAMNLMAHNLEQNALNDPTGVHVQLVDALKDAENKLNNKNSPENQERYNQAFVAVNDNLIITKLESKNTAAGIHEQPTTETGEGATEGATEGFSVVTNDTGADEEVDTNGDNSDTAGEDSEEKQLLRKLSLVAQAENRPTLTLNTKSRSYREAKKVIGDIQDYKDFIDKIAEQSKEALEARIKDAPYTSRKTYRDKLKAVSLNPSAVLFKDFEGSTPLAQDSLLTSTTDA
jgi:hypothetical protein